MLGKQFPSLSISIVCVNMYQLAILDIILPIISGQVTYYVVLCLIPTGKLKYDIFLSFANEDMEITETRIKVPLEERGYVVCWHHRDFIAGRPIIENMTIAVGASRMTVVVLSEAFTGSKFCIDELELAMLRTKQTKRRCIVPVLLRNCTLPDGLENFTYISLEGRDFMKKLCRDLGKSWSQSHVYYNTIHVHMYTG